MRNSIVYKNNVLRNIILFSIVLLLLFLTVSRGITVGTDYPAYNGYFYSTKDELKVQYIENGYILLNSFAQSLNIFIIIPMCEFIISFFGMYSLAKVNNCNDFSFISMYILTYTYMQSFNALRQFIAIGFITFGCTFLFSNRKFKLFWFVIFILLAYEFHSSSLIMLIIPILMKIRVTNVKVLLAGILTSFLFISKLGLKIIQPLIMMNDHYAIKYSDQASFLISAGNKGIVQFLPVIIQFILFYLFLTISKKNQNSSYVVNQVKYNFVLSGYLFFLMFYSVGGNGVMDRIQMFFFIFCIMANCYFIDNVAGTSSEIRYLYQVSVILFWIVYCLLRLIINNADVVPYVFN
ncbi:EpsG family protein [Limosilactobacillus vaginalis]|uniref:EpsG family protein n=1 Tax=Limosilactobacillus vaginalis TaxID=1633 RepID=UPI00145FCEB8|nr:EpsG family protein [Limosilactobacillus vaginalis]